MSIIDTLKDALEIALDTPTSGPRSAGTWAAAEAIGRAALLTADGHSTERVKGEQVIFGYYWEVVHKATGEVVNDGFTRYHSGDQIPPSEVDAKVKGFVVRTMALFKAVAAAVDAT